MNEIRDIIVTLEHSIALRISEEVQQNELTNSLFFPASQVSMYENILGKVMAVLQVS